VAFYTISPIIVKLVPDDSVQIIVAAEYLALVLGPDEGVPVEVIVTVDRKSVV